MPVRERFLTIGITGSGKSYQWLKLAETLLPTGAKFRVLDTDNDIPYMLETQFPQLKPENKGNVFVHPAVDWPDYRSGVKWIQAEPVKPDDWLVVDRADSAWDTVQRYFTTEVFGEDMGEYFLRARKAIEDRGGKDRFGKPATSVAPEAYDGWKDWSVMNKLYNDWIFPIIYRVPCNVYLTARVERLDRGEKDTELMTLFGGLGIRPAGQKALGHQTHVIFLLIPGEDKWFITTVKDRSGRTYFKKVQLVSLYTQYLVAKAGWPAL